MTIDIRPMVAMDLPACWRLSRQAGWNQTEADWRRFLDLQPDGCFVADCATELVGTVTTCIFGRAALVGWVAMVLVDPTVRRQGIGTALVEHALEFLDQHGVGTVRLDATPLGRPLYERLGFVEQFELARYEGKLPPAPAVPEVEAATVGDQWEALTALDEEVTGTDRRRLLFRLFAGQSGAAVPYVRDADRPRGFLALRRGERAWQLGPCIAAPEVGPLLFAEACRRYPGRPILVDVPLPNEAATRLADAQGLAVQRHLTRMCRGVPVCERLDWLWASSGPEKG
jgi:GNAT superfamily N-acetyltransferase